LKAQAVLDDMRTLTGHAFYPHEFADGAAQMLLDNWSAVSAVANELVKHRRIEGTHPVKAPARPLLAEG
jgi:hypothetical protein